MKAAERRSQYKVGLLIAVALAPACAGAIVSTTPGADLGGVPPAVIYARAVAGRYRLRARSVSDPSKETVLCSGPAYAVREDASFLELSPGSYVLEAVVSPAGVRTFFDVLIRGPVTVQASQCYVLSIACRREEGLDWEQTCHPILHPRDCSSRPSGRRVPMIGEEAC
jgi:hypothetical protein